MKVGNPKALDAERNAMRDAFDAVWLASSERNATTLRASRCAAKLDRPNYEQPGLGWRILPGSRGTYSSPIAA